MSEGWHVTAFDINPWAERNPREAQEKLPLLIGKLILASTKPSYIRIPSGNAILLRGWDGVLEVEEGNSFVPSDLSVWELGSGRNIKSKADRDYLKRTKDPHGIDKKKAAFIFITSRIWGKKNEWDHEKNSEGEWKIVRFLDAVDLETWLHQCPGVHRWFARLIGKRPEGALDIEQEWDAWRYATDPPSNESLVIASRNKAVEELIQKLRNNPSVIRIFGESKDEVYAFAVASIIRHAEELTPRVLVSDDPKEWMSVIESENPLILIPRFDTLVNLGLAVERGHWVIVPESGLQYRSQQGSIVLSKPNKHSLVEALVEMEIEEEKAQRIVKETKGFLIPLRRHSELHPRDFKKPEWATAEHATPLIAVLLSGAWDEKNIKDREKIAKLSGLSYEELERTLHAWSVSDDPPVRKVGSIWQVVSRQDMWQLLSPFITERMLENFGEIAIEILQELDPRYELKPEERWFANIHGENLEHSEMLRKHIAEMLAMLGTHGDEDLRNVGETSAQDRVSFWVRKILFDNMSAHRWYSLREFLPYLAEASSETFLEAVEKGLEGDQTPLMELFVEEGIFGGCSHAGLLWALEGISWNLDYLSRVALILAILSKLDPGGRWANRPFNSLRKIFLTWLPQTKASVKEKLKLLDLILSREPEIGWKLLLSLIPKGVGEISTPINKPYFRDWAEGWESKLTRKEYYEYILAISNKIIAYAEENSDKCLIDLIDILPNLPKEAFNSAIKNLQELNADKISQTIRQEIYEKLRDTIWHHRKFSDAKWALPEEAIQKLEEVLKRFTPDDPVDRHEYLFDKSHDIVCESGLDFREEEKQAEEMRKSALENIWKTQKQEGIIRLVQHAKLAWAVGYHLAFSSFTDEIEDLILRWLSPESKQFSEVAKAFVYTRFNQDKNYPQIVLKKYKEKWNPDKWADFCLGLPFSKETFNFMESLPEDVRKIYWKNVTTFLHHFEGNKEQTEWIIKQLIDHNRPVAALNAASQYLHTIAKETGLDANILAEILERVATYPKDVKSERMDPYEIEKIFEYLQQSSDINKERLVQLEWLYIPYFWHNKYHVRVRPITLIREVLDNPDLFVQLIRLAFKAKKPIEGEFSDLTPEQSKRLAENAYFLLGMIEGLPGQLEGDVDLSKLIEWIEFARDKCKDVNRLPICDEKIGEILSHAPTGKDGLWPHEAVRDALEKVASRDMERGIEIGIYKQRGVHTKSPEEGGKQERELAKRYNQFADKLKLKWPRTAATLKRIAEGYIRVGSSEDLRVELDDLQ